MSRLPRPVRRARTGWLAAYVVCIVFVFSFIVFETLDVDGSDFPVSTTKMVVKLTEPPHDDLRRAVLAVPLQYPVKTPERGLDRSGDARRFDRVAVRESEPRTPFRRHRITLPRGSLSDPPAPA